MALPEKNSMASQLEALEKQLSSDNRPTHIAIIMDGNGRWAKQKNKPRTFGHKAGVESLETMIKACIDFNISHLSVFAFSSENWKRPSREVNFLLHLLKTQISIQKRKLIKQNVRTRIIGNRSQLSKQILVAIDNLEKETETYQKLNLNIFINYGSREEIIDTVNRIRSDHPSSKTEITEEIFNSYLLTNKLPDPDILIRTSGEKRISNFLLWQIAYTELFFSNKLWPEFNREDLLKILIEYQQRHRRFGGL